MVAYQKIADDMYRRIAARHWAVGERLPTIAELQQHYGVGGVQTIRNAYNQLIDQGLVVGRQGAGYFLVELPDNDDLRGRVARLRKTLRDATRELNEIEKMLDL